MIENPITYGNHHDSLAREFMDYCQGCGGEIFYGEGYLDFSGDPIHTESQCINGCSLRIWITSTYGSV
ncbi:hypothetical protein COJ09_23295 [Bacillus thuringiensis]|nr:hypothetical protein [Bacillus thuringiensis]PFK54931.1 hypothetical protein COJ09_23295 [Bacillus thuringiensis]PGR79505.1 hypothetical protein COC43_08070 [Bacillus thuringiensis]